MFYMWVLVLLVAVLVLVIVPMIVLVDVLVIAIVPMLVIVPVPVLGSMPYLFVFLTDQLFRLGVCQAGPRGYGEVGAALPGEFTDQTKTKSLLEKIQHGSTDLLMQLSWSLL